MKRKYLLSLCKEKRGGERKKGSLMPFYALVVGIRVMEGINNSSSRQQISALKKRLKEIGNI